MMIDARRFFDCHAEETALIVCNGPSLNRLPLALLQKYPSFGCNSIVTWQAFRPSYYVAVDDRVRREFGDLILERFGTIPKFIPTPNLDLWNGPCFYRWFHRPGPLWEFTTPWNPDTLIDPGITWYCCPHAMLQIAAFMGFSTLLIVGMDHSDNRKEHAWGIDEAMPGPTASGEWWRHIERGHRELDRGLNDMGVAVINITPDTQETAFTKGAWRDWL